LEAGDEGADFRLEIEDEFKRLALIGVQSTRDVQRGPVLEEFREHRLI